MKVNRNIIKSKTPFVFVWLFDSLSVLLSFFVKRSKVYKPYTFKAPFFIIGSGRSGNTLLRSMLVSGNEVSIPPESYVLPRIYRRYRALSFLSWDLLSSSMVSEYEAYKEFYTWETNFYKAHQKVRALDKSKRSLAHIINEIYKCYIESTGKTNQRWGDKTPINTIFIDKISKVFPNAQYVQIIRDPRDVVCSYVGAGLYPNYMDALTFWKQANIKAEALKAKLPSDNFYQVKYESLVINPEIELKKICHFLNIKFSKSMLLFWKNTDNLGDVKFKEHHKNIGNPISTKSIGKYKFVLSTQEIEAIEREAYTLMIKYNYLEQ